MRGLSNKALSMVLAVALPASVAMADMRGAILDFNGQASLNGVSARSGSAVLAGDVVQAQGSVVSLKSSGSTVVMLGDSRLKYEPASIDVHAGAAQVKTDTGMTARVGGVTVTPAQKKSTYELGSKDGKILVAAVTGSLRISNGTQSVLLPAGSMATLDTRQDDRRGPSAPVEGGGEGGFRISKRVGLILLFGAGAGAAVAAWALSDDNDPISSTR